MAPVRLLVVNGCSMTFGDELPDRRSSPWGAVLARHLGAELVNLGACAGSNQRVVRTTVERLGRLTAERGLHPSEVLYLAMWTRLNRYELYADEHDPQGGLPDDWDDAGWCRVHPSYLERKDQRSTTWYRYLQHDTGDRANFLLGWALLDAWLARGGWRYGFLWAFDPPPGLFDGVETYRDQIDWSRLCGGPSLFAFGRARKDLAPGRHPREGSHRAFAEDHLLDWVARLGSGGPAAPPQPAEVPFGPW